MPSDEKVLTNPSRLFHLVLVLDVGLLSPGVSVRAKPSLVPGNDGSGGFGFLISRLPFKRLVPLAELVRGGGMIGRRGTGVAVF